MSLCVSKDNNGKYILQGVFQEFSPMSYPGRVHGEYEWDSKNKR